MAVTITLPGAHPGETLHAGIIFTDGVVKLDEVSPNAERYLVWGGARVRRPKAQPPKPSTPEPEAPSNGDA